jgi:hypothetical protein
LSLVPEKDRARAAGTFMPTEQRAAAWRICIDPAYVDDDMLLSAILAHEFAHGVLHRDGVTLSNPGSDEVLTDVAAALVGFGGLMLDSQRRVKRGFRGAQLTWVVGSGGYLSALELEHILRRHQTLL